VQIKLFQRWGEDGAYYATCHGEFLENQLFESRQALAASIIEE
jgi:hypothetical protein